MQPLKTDATYDDLCAVPDNFVAENTLRAPPFDGIELELKALWI